MTVHHQSERSPYPRCRLTGMVRIATGVWLGTAVSTAAMAPDPYTRIPKFEHNRQLTDTGSGIHLAVGPNHRPNARSRMAPTYVQDSVLALVGGTVIDGNGGAPMPDATLVIKGDRIVALGPRATTVIPSGARRIDVRGKYLTPGFIDTNVHVTPYTGRWIVDDNSDQGMTKMALDAAHQFLEHGVTTICDTWGVLLPSLVARDSLQRGGAVGARLLVAGNIIGLDGDGAEDLTQGMGSKLRGITPDSLRTLIDRYFDKGVDFIKIAVTDHSGINSNPRQLLFSQRALETMVHEAHQRGKIVESHTQGIEGLRLAARVGVDVVQHPEILTGDSMPKDLARLLAKQHVVCAMMTVGGSSTVDDSAKGRDRKNSQTLIRNGCLISISTDDMFGMSNDGNLDPHGPHVWGEWTLRGIETLVALGMTPAQALTAATKNGAIAAGAASKYGTLAVGKQADVLVLRANPLVDIHNIRRLELVLHGGQVLQTPPTVSHP